MWFENNAYKYINRTTEKRNEEELKNEMKERQLKAPNSTKSNSYSFVATMVPIPFHSILTQRHDSNVLEIT